MKLEKLLCLKNLGSRVEENLWESQTMKLFLPLLHEITESVEGSSTISYVLVKNGGGPISFNPSIGRGEEDEAEPEASPPPLHGYTKLSSSNFTTTISISSQKNGKKGKIFEVYEV